MKTLAEVAAWLRLVEWRDEASRDKMHQAVRLIDLAASGTPLKVTAPGEMLDWARALARDAGAKGDVHKLSSAVESLALMLQSFDARVERLESSR